MPPKQILQVYSGIFAQPFPGIDSEALRHGAESATVTRAIDAMI